MLFSNMIFEAIVVEVSYDFGTCIINPLSANESYNIEDVPLPYIAGSGNTGIFCSVEVGSRVLAMYTSGDGRESTVIAGLLPKTELLQRNFNTAKPLDVPVGTVSYPEMTKNRMVLRGDLGSNMTFFEGGDITFGTVSGAGVYLRKNRNKTSYSTIAEDSLGFTNAGKMVSGSVRRISGVQRNLFPRPDRNEEPIFADSTFATTADSIGFFPGSLPLKRSYGNRRRNPEISEYRHVINEFSTDSMFTGFDDEVERVSNGRRLFQNSDTLKRNREVGNTLHLAEYELIEIIGGNVVDINGNILDINYRSLAYGGPRNTVPTQEIDVSYDRARRVSRRGIGWHFQLSTNTKGDDLSSTLSNLVFDIDKEGLIKANIPASSDTGNIPFPSVADFIGDNDQVVVSYSNPSRTEPVPVTLRDSAGEIVFPGKNSQGVPVRFTGVRFSNSDENPYFPSGDDLGLADPVRINPTKYHNMYAAAERLIANTIRIVNVPSDFVTDNGFIQAIPVGQPFEIPVPEDLSQAENSEDPTTLDVLGRGSDPLFPTFMSTIAVDPGPPAIYPGGDTIVAGILYPDDDANPPFSNSFISSISDGEIGATIADSEGEPRAQIGGKSANLSFAGSIEMSVGADNFDRKSMLFDTEGGVVSWLGKDRNNRSMIMQTDGEVLFNIGGTYSGETAEDATMNIGRLEIRVNVTDKGFVTSQFARGETLEDGGNPRAESDYIISISENGLVIAGMKANTPMIIRNNGSLLVESTESDVILKGTQVKIVESKGKSKTVKSTGR